MRRAQFGIDSIKAIMFGDCCNSYLLLLGGIGLIVFIIYKYLTRPKVYNDPPDTVVLCQFTRGPQAPSNSPFPLKLETFLRMADIPYKSTSDRGFSSKHKLPFIIYNGEEVADSQFCIEFLNKKFDIDLNKDLTVEQKATARAFRKMAEESMYWGLVIDRLCGKVDVKYIKMSWQNKMPTPIIWFIQWSMRKAAHGQGMGRHSTSEVQHMNLGDIKAIADYLGNKAFLMGDKATEVDCSLFGILAQFRWHAPGSPYEKAVTVDHPNLNAYLLRMKETFWKDWDDCIHHNNTREPKK